MSTCSTDKNDTLPTAKWSNPHSKPAAKPGVKPRRSEKITRTIAPHDGVNHPAKSGIQDNAIDNAAIIAASTHTKTFLFMKKEPPSFIEKHKETPSKTSKSNTIPTHVLT